MRQLFAESHTTLRGTRARILRAHYRQIHPNPEKRGWYLADVFYTDRTGKQVYLNNLLSEKGMRSG
jgi:hypothetical protein